MIIRQSQERQDTEQTCKDLASTFGECGLFGLADSQAWKCLVSEDGPGASSSSCWSCVATIPLQCLEGFWR